MLRWRDACIRLIRLIRLIKYDDGAPVFALTGYAVASHVIPRGFARRSLVWLGRKVAVGVIISHRRPKIKTQYSQYSQYS